MFGWCPFSGGHGQYAQPHPTTNYQLTRSGEHVTVAQMPYHAGGARPYYDNYPMNANNAMAAANHHGGGSQHRYEAYEGTYQDRAYGGEETYAYGAGAAPIFVVTSGGGGGGGGCLLRRCHRGA